MLQVRDFKRILMPLCAGLVVSIAAGSALPARAADACLAKTSKYERQQCENFTHSAPGDEYFGKMKMSYLGINNTFHDEAIRAGAFTTDGAIINKVSFATEALEAWSKKYPHDPQLARSYFLGITMLSKIYTRDAQQRAWNYLQLEVSRFGSTYFGKLEKAALAKGFTMHYYADAVSCAAPSLTAQDPTASPAPTPVLTGQPKVVLLTPDCIPTPAPTSLPSPSASPPV